MKVKKQRAFNLNRVMRRKPDTPPQLRRYIIGRWDIPRYLHRMMRFSLDIPVCLQRMMRFFQDTPAYLHRMMREQPDKPVNPQRMDIYSLKCDKQIKSRLFEEKWEDVRALLHHQLTPLQYFMLR